jgi:catechol 2,3-dioxygenase-like lactoylglutathione lyase family enzyme
MIEEYSGSLRFSHGGRNMKRKAVITITLTGILCGAGLVYTSHARTSSAEKHAFTPDGITYGPPPAFVAPGAQLAVLEGNPGASSGDYTIRLKMPDGYRIAPHWHPLRENVTVISGTFKVGMGDRFEESKMGAFPAGSFAFLDPDMHHYAMASGEVVVQVHGTAPLQFNYVNPEDDPSRKR